MNKIVIDNNKITYKLNDSIKINQNNDLVDEIEIEFFKNSKLIIEYSYDSKKNDIKFLINKNISANILEIYNVGKSKLRNNYNLEENSNLRIERFYNTSNTRELNIANLNGNNSNIEIFSNIISTNKNKFDFYIYHNHKNTNSNIVNHILNIDKGSIVTNITGSVENGIKNCVLNQENRVINLTNNKCIINPILLIDEFDVEANHSALVGKFNDDEVFYLMRLGISYNDATRLLIEGLLLSNLTINEKIKNDILNIIKKVWR